jgi:hypothetical protein
MVDVELMAMIGVVAGYAGGVAAIGRLGPVPRALVDSRRRGSCHGHMQTPVYGRRAGHHVL